MEKAEVIVNKLLEVDDVDVNRYIGGLKDNVYNPDEQLRLESFLRWNHPDQFLVITSNEGYHLDVWRGDGEKRHHSGPFGFTQLREMKEKWPESRWLNFPVRESEDADADVQRYLEMVKRHPQLRRYSKEQLRQYLATRPPEEPGPPSEPHQIVREAIGDVPPDPEPSSAEVQRLLPTKTYTLRGSSMLHVPGIIRMAQTEWRSRSKKQKEWAMNLLKVWEGLPEEACLAILNGKAQIEANGNDAIVTIKAY